jgi:hypothetical protein
MYDDVVKLFGDRRIIVRPARPYRRVSPPYEESSIPIPERRIAFSSRILSKFANQWRHTLRSSYAKSTFRRLAKAIVCIATNNFRVDELSTR